MTKSQYLISVIAFALVCLALPFLLACDQGCDEHYGVCACDQKPNVEPTAYLTSTSDEKPSRHPEPAWQRGEVKASEGKEERESAYKQDKAKDDANEQGKKAAGIP